MTALIAAALLIAPVKAPQMGLNVGETMIAYDPYHLTGPDQGTETCPVCEYLNRPMVIVWSFRQDPRELSPLLRRIEEATDRHEKHEFKSFFTFLTNEWNAKNLRKELPEWATENAAQLTSITVLPHDNEAVERAKFPTDGSVRNVVWVFKNRQISHKWVNIKADKPTVDAIIGAIEWQVKR